MATASPTGGTGIDAAKLSAAPSGQVVYGGHLLYTYTPDTAAGETKGQGVGGVWHVVAPSGDIISLIRTRLIRTRASRARARSRRRRRSTTR